MFHLGKKDARFLLANKDNELIVIGGRNARKKPDRATQFVAAW